MSCRTCWATPARPSRRRHTRSWRRRRPPPACCGTSPNVRETRYVLLMRSTKHRRADGRQATFLARRVTLPMGGGADQHLPMKQWLRAEWQRSGLPLSLTNAAAGVANAATRKWFTQCHLWYMPPGSAIERLAQYANDHGAADGRPYF